MGLRVKGSLTPSRTVPIQREGPNHPRKRLPAPPRPALAGVPAHACALHALSCGTLCLGSGTLCSFVAAAPRFYHCSATSEGAYQYHSLVSIAVFSSPPGWCSSRTSTSWSRSRTRCHHSRQANGMTLCALASYVTNNACLYFKMY